MSIGRRGSAGSGGLSFMTSPSAMPTRSAPSSLAFALTSADVTLRRKISTISRLRLVALPGSRRALRLALFEILHLARHDAFVTVGPDPADIPIVEAGYRVAALS